VLPRPCSWFKGGSTSTGKGRERKEGEEREMRKGEGIGEVWPPKAYSWIRPCPQY